MTTLSYNELIAALKLPDEETVNKMTPRQAEQVFLLTLSYIKHLNHYSDAAFTIYWRVPNLGSTKRDDIYKKLSTALNKRGVSLDNILSSLSESKVSE